MFAFRSLQIAFVRLWFLGKIVGTIGKFGQDNFSCLSPWIIHLKMGVTDWETLPWARICGLEAWVICATVVTRYLDVDFNSWQKKKKKKGKGKGLCFPPWLGFLSHISFPSGMRSKERGAEAITWLSNRCVREKLKICKDPILSLLTQLFRKHHLFSLLFVQLRHQQANSGYLMGECQRIIEWSAECS